MKPPDYLPAPCLPANLEIKYSGINYKIPYLPALILSTENGIKLSWEKLIYQELYSSSVSYIATIFSGLTSGIIL
jgi:hypothetical protein